MCLLYIRLAPDNLIVKTKTKFVKMDFVWEIRFQLVSSIIFYCSTVGFWRCYISCKTLKPTNVSTSRSFCIVALLNNKYQIVRSLDIQLYLIDGPDEGIFDCTLDSRMPCLPVKPDQMILKDVQCQKGIWNHCWAISVLNSNSEKW